jgi:DNA-binding PucR family transcriptional regulator
MTLTPSSEALSAREQIANVASRVGHGLVELASDIRGAIEASVPALRDPGTTTLLNASIQQNIDAMLGVLAHNLEPSHVDPPSAAVEYARRLAQRGVSTFALIRGYRVGQTRVLRRLIEDRVEHSTGDRERGRAGLEMVERISDYVDRVVEQLIIEYARARAEWLNPSAILTARVRRILSDTTLDTGEAQENLGAYSVRQHHLGLELWMHDPAEKSEALTDLRRTADRLGGAGSHDSVLFVPVDEVSACVWLPLGTRSELDRAVLADIISDAPQTYCAIGEPGFSLPGFRRTHQQALSAETVALTCNPPRERLTPYRDVGPLALMCNDLRTARTWVGETLGALATDDERHAWLRETASIFLSHGGSYTATAKALGLHRNTAQYRLRQAEDARGRPLRDGHLDVELALLACHWFGPAVLRDAVP